MEKVKYRKSQNFLYNKKLVNELLNLTNINSSDYIIEIGAGKGIITNELVKKSRKVSAIEFDEIMVDILVNKFKSVENVEIISQDFLRYSFLNEKCKVFSNIPFSITTPIINKLIDNSIGYCYLIVQKEVALKYAGKYESMKTLMLKPYYKFEILMFIDRSNFYPIPNVDCALLAISKRDVQLVSDSNRKKYCSFIKGIFNNNKSIKKSSKLYFTYRQIKRLSHELKFDINISATNLTFRQLLALFKYYLDIDK